METIKFKREYLASYKQILTPGKFALQVSNDVTDKNLVTDEDGGKPRYIVGLKAIAPDKIAQLKEVFKDNSEVDIEQTNGLFMTLNIWKTGNEQLPVKGEFIACVADFVAPREGDERVLRIISHKVNAAKEAPALDLNTLFAEEATPAKQGATLQHS